MVEVENTRMTKAVERELVFQNKDLLTSKSFVWAKIANVKISGQTTGHYGKNCKI